VSARFNIANLSLVTFFLLIRQYKNSITENFTFKKIVSGLNPVHCSRAQGKITKLFVFKTRRDLVEWVMRQAMRHDAAPLPGFGRAEMAHMRALEDALYMEPISPTTLAGWFHFH